MPLVKNGRDCHRSLSACRRRRGTARRRRGAGSGRAVSRRPGSAACNEPARLGVIWPNNRDIDELVPYLDRLAAVALVFPSFHDGRAYSQARLLRERHGYRRRVARHRTGAARPVRLHAARRLRFVRGEEGRPTPRRSTQPRKPLFGVLPADRRRPAQPRCTGACNCVIRRARASDVPRFHAAAIARVGVATARSPRSKCCADASPAEVDRSGAEDRRPRTSRAGVVVRHGIGGVAQGDGRCRSGHSRGLPRYRLAVPGNAGLSRHADRKSLGLRDVRSIKPLEETLSARGSGQRIVVRRSRCLLPHPQGRAAGARAKAVRGLDQRPQAFSGRHCARTCPWSSRTATG